MKDKRILLILPGLLMFVCMVVTMWVDLLWLEKLVMTFFFTQMAIMLIFLVKQML